MSTTYTLSKLLAISLAFFSIALFANVVSAQTTFGVGNTATGTTFGDGNPGGNNGQTLVNPLKADNLEELLDLVLLAAIRIGSIILVLALVWVGFLFVAARGNEEKLRTARTAFFWTVIGGLILLGATGIKEVIKSTGSALGS